MSCPAPPPAALILGCTGPTLTEAERALFRRRPPAGFLLYQRNCIAPDQIRALTAGLRDATGRDDLLILIDQEGGRHFSRLGPPHWRRHAAPHQLGRMARAVPELAERGSYLLGRMIGWDLADLGINVNCAPVCDVADPETHPIIAPRTFGDDPQIVAKLAGAYARGLLDSRVIPVIKHMPGHGRARADSHRTLPRTDASPAALAARDFAPFRDLGFVPAAMTGHMVYQAIDPQAPASASARLFRDVLRGTLGYRGLIISDELAMDGLAEYGSMTARLAAVLAAGTDLALRGSGFPEEQEALLAAAPPITPDTGRRIAAALAMAEAWSCNDQERNALEIEYGAIIKVLTKFQ